MRSACERLGRTAMAPYAYVAGKSELADLMHPRVQGRSGEVKGRGDRPAIS